MPHYDSGFDYKDGRRYTLMSVVITLASGLGEESTRLLLNPRRNLPVSEWDFADGSCAAHPREVLACVHANAGDALIFDHRLRHHAPS